MKLTLATKRVLLALFLCVIAAIYGIAWMAPAVGLHDADSSMLRSAEGLGDGDTAGFPAPPAFPLLLTLFLKVSEQALWLKFLPLLCTLCWLAATYRLLRKLGAEHWSALLLVSLCAAAPGVVFMSTHLIAESLLALLITAALLAWLEDRMIVAGILAALATLTSPAGAALIAACAATLTIRGRFRRALEFTATSVILAAPWYAWAMVHSGASPYAHIAPNELALMFGTNVMCVFAAPADLFSGLHDVYAAIFTFCLTVWCIWRLRRIVPDLFLLLYCFVLVFWPRPPISMLAPVLPLILWLFWRAFRNVKIKEALAAAVLLLALAPIWFDVVLVRTTVRAGDFPVSPAQQPNDWKQMNLLFDAIRSDSPADAVIIAIPDGLFAVKTGRRAIRGFTPNAYSTYYQPDGQAVTPDRLLANLQSSGAGFVALTPNRAFPDSAAFHNSVRALERDGILEPVPVPGLTQEYRLLRRASASVK